MFKVISVTSLLLVASLSAAPAAKSSTEAEQLRVIEEMSGKLRARLLQLPVALPAEQPPGQIRDLAVTLNRDPVRVDGERFDGVVLTAPATKASFAWAFVYPPNVSRWYILREGGEMKGFSDFIKKPRTGLPGADAWAPAGTQNVTFQRLNAAALLPGERYVLWFAFKDAAPAEITLRAGFFPSPSLNNSALPALLFPKDAAKP